MSPSVRESESPLPPVSINASTRGGEVICGAVRNRAPERDLTVQLQGSISNTSSKTLQDEEFPIWHLRRRRNRKRRRRRSRRRERSSEGGEGVKKKSQQA